MPGFAVPFPTGSGVPAGVNVTVGVDVIVGVGVGVGVFVTVGVGVRVIVGVGVTVAVGVGVVVGVEHATTPEPFANNGHAVGLIVRSPCTVTFPVKVLLPAKLCVVVLTHPASDTPAVTHKNVSGSVLQSVPTDFCRPEPAASPKTLFAAQTAAVLLRTYACGVAGAVVEVGVSVGVVLAVGVALHSTCWFASNPSCEHEGVTWYKITREPENEPSSPRMSFSTPSASETE